LHAERKLAILSLYIFNSSVARLSQLHPIQPWPGQASTRSDVIASYQKPLGSDTTQKYPATVMKFVAHKGPNLRAADSGKRFLNECSDRRNI
jgi:hypothetical protein